jgi:aminoglycoside phosphotransferase (APT) family kinase protein
VPPQAIELEHRGWRWHATLPGDRMMFVPVDDDGAHRLVGERRLLAEIGPRLSFAVPRPLGAIDGPVDVRQRVRGEPGVGWTHRIAEDVGLAAAFADDLARVLAELHRALDDHELRTLARPVRADEYPLAEPRLRPVIASLPAEIRGLSHSALDRYAALEPEPDVLVHNDLALHNLAFDPSTLRVAGLFDFEEAARAGRHRDFKYMPSYGPRITERVLDLYRERSGTTIDVARMRLLHFASALSFWAWREADPVGHDRGSGRDRDVALAWVGMALFAIPD